MPGGGTAPNANSAAVIPGVAKLEQPDTGPAVYDSMQLLVSEMCFVLTDYGAGLAGHRSRLPQNP